MKLSDIIQEGKISQEGIREIEKLITENDKLKSEFSYFGCTVHHGYPVDVYMTKEKITKETSKSISELCAKIDETKAYKRQIRDLEYGITKCLADYEEIKSMSVREFRKWRKLNK